MATRSGRVGTGRNIGVRLSYPRCSPPTRLWRGAARRSPQRSCPSSSPASGTPISARTGAASDSRRPLSSSARSSPASRSACRSFDLAGLAVQTWFLIGLFVANLVLARLPRVRDRRCVDDRPRARRSVSRHVARPRAKRACSAIAGLVAVLLVMSVAHVAVARYDLLAAADHRIASSMTTRSDCPEQSPGPDDGSPEPSQRADAGREHRSRGHRPSRSRTWDGQERLNILLIGADEQGGGAQHGHDDHGLDRPADQPGRHVPAAPRHGRRAAPARPGAGLLRRRLSGQDQQLLLANANRADWFPGNTGRIPAATTGSRRSWATCTASTSSTTSRSTSRASGRSSTRSAA